MSLEIYVPALEGPCFLPTWRVHFAVWTWYDILSTLWIWKFISLCKKQFPITFILFRISTRQLLNALFGAFLGGLPFSFDFEVAHFSKLYILFWSSPTMFDTGNNGKIRWKCRKNGSHVLARVRQWRFWLLKFGSILAFRQVVSLCCFKPS